MTFEERLMARARDIDASLAKRLGDKVAPIDDVPARLDAAMRHAVMSGGKRIRPFVLIETAALFGVAEAAALPAALALELIHCYSLVHDDLPAMDNDTLRRGKPTVWTAFDEWTAILAGDALLTQAFELLAYPHPGVAPELQTRLITGLARAAGRAGMVGGQCLDLEADKLGVPATASVAHIVKLQAMKTGALFRFACQAGAMLGRAAPPQELALTQFGERLGEAFQLADDLLDTLGDAATVGKATGKDAAAGKATLVGLLGLDQAKSELARIETAGLAALSAFGDRAGVLRDALHFAVQRRW